ncbi:MAG: hypothetical protein EOP32_18950 [Rhodococcus sp. (in: high G+C Gram-positive bacteria)]|nr:MAG: hypothetical protein EOP32_18950 [Rhodococcus sp. (in: high G+C Gram-positive bacteria)]
MTELASPSSAAHRTAVTLPMRDIAALLVENLGVAMTASIGGVDRKTINRWVNGRPARSVGEGRLRAAFQVFQLVQAVESASTVRAWFIAMNPQLDDESPAEAMAAGRHRDVMAAARAFVAGQ